MRITRWLTIISLVLVAVFIVQNHAVVEVRFLLWSLFMSRSVLILLVLATGMLIGWLLAQYWRKYR